MKGANDLSPPGLPPGFSTVKEFANQAQVKNFFAVLGFYFRCASRPLLLLRGTPELSQLITGRATTCNRTYYSTTYVETINLGGTSNLLRFLYWERESEVVHR